VHHFFLAENPFLVFSKINHSCIIHEISKINDSNGSRKICEQEIKSSVFARSKTWNAMIFIVSSKSLGFHETPYTGPEPSPIAFYPSLQWPSSGNEQNPGVEELSSDFLHGNRKLASVNLQARGNGAKVTA
jgi:hypothetical protein